MKMLDPIWEEEYRQGNRKHRHACWHRSKIIHPGENIIRCRWPGGTKAAHLACADSLFMGSITVREMMTHHGNMVLADMGYSMARKAVEEFRVTEFERSRS